MPDIEPSVPVTPPKRRLYKRVVACVAIALAVAGVAAGSKHGRHYVFAKRFAVVEPGQLYRSGQLKPWPLKRVIDERHIHTVLSLLEDDASSTDQANEQAILKQRGVAFVRIPMPGNGRGDFDALDKAAAVIADAQQRPLLVHCAAGQMRTSAAYAAWRLRYCGWTLDQVLAETAKYDVTPEEHPAFCEHLRRYYETRIRPSVAERQPAGGEAPGS